MSAGIADRIVSAALLLVALIHLLPAMGMLGADRLMTLYGIDASATNLEILLRHRAVLFAILGGYLAIAAFRPDWQASALVVAFLSVLSFLWLAASVGGYNAWIARVVRVDIVAFVALLVGAIAYWWRSAQTTLIG